MRVSAAIMRAHQGYGNPWHREQAHQPVNYATIPATELRGQLNNPTLTRSARIQVARQLGMAGAA